LLPSGHTGAEARGERVNLDDLGRDVRDRLPLAAARNLEGSESARGLNGSCLIAPGILLIADCFAGLIWRADLSADGGKATARVWLKHDSMAHDPDGPMPDQPGINGVQYAANANYLYYTNTARELFMRVRVDPDTNDAVDEPEFVAGGMMGDDFCLDEDAGFAYLATHRQNTRRRHQGTADSGRRDRPTGDGIAG
jgi:hypothetical protein